MKINKKILLGVTALMPFLAFQEVRGSKAFGDFYEAWEKEFAPVAAPQKAPTKKKKKAAPVQVAPPPVTNYTFQPAYHHYSPPVFHLDYRPQETITGLQNASAVIASKADAEKEDFRRRLNLLTAERDESVQAAADRAAKMKLAEEAAELRARLVQAAEVGVKQDLVITLQDTKIHKLEEELSFLRIAKQAAEDTCAVLRTENERLTAEIEKAKEDIKTARFWYFSPDTGMLTHEKPPETE